MLYNIDIDYGRENEIIVFQKLKSFFSNEKMKELDYYHEFDYTNEYGTILFLIKRLHLFNLLTFSIVSLYSLKLQRRLFNSHKIVPYSLV